MKKIKKTQAGKIKLAQEQIKEEALPVRSGVKAGTASFKHLSF